MSAANRETLGKIDIILDEIYSSERIYRNNMISLHHALTETLSRDYPIGKFSKEEQAMLERFMKNIKGLSDNRLVDPALTDEAYQSELAIKARKGERISGSDSSAGWSESLKALRQKRIAAFQKFVTGQEFFFQQTLFNEAAVEQAAFDNFLMTIKKTHPEFIKRVLEKFAIEMNSRKENNPIMETALNPLSALTIQSVQRGPRYGMLINTLAEEAKKVGGLSDDLSKSALAVQEKVLELNTELKSKTGYTTAQALLGQLLSALETSAHADDPQVKKAYQQLQQMSYDIALGRSKNYENILDTLKESVKKLEPVLKKSEFAKAVNVIEISEFKSFIISNQWKNLHDAVKNTMDDCQKYYENKLRSNANDQRAKLILAMLNRLKPKLAKLNPEPSNFFNLSKDEQKKLFDKRYKVPDAMSYNEMRKIIDELHDARAGLGPLFSIHEDHFSNAIGHLLKEQNSSEKLLIKNCGPLTLPKELKQKVSATKSQKVVVKPKEAEEEGDKGEKPRK